MIAVLSIIFASVVCVYGLGDDGSKMQYCDNVDRIADSAWEMCGHHRKGFTWNDVEMCEVIKILINFNGMNLNLHFQEKTMKFCSDLKVAGKELDFECPGFKLPSRKDFDEKGITALLCLSYYIFCIYPHLLEFTLADVNSEWTREQFISYMGCPIPKFF